MIGNTDSYNKQEDTILIVAFQESFFEEFFSILMGSILRMKYHFWVV